MSKHRSKYICPLCGAKYAYATNKCKICGWVQDDNQENDKNLERGNNKICFNKYKRVFYLDWGNIKTDYELIHVDETIPQLYFQNSLKYDSITDGELDKIIETLKSKEIEYPPYKCKMCGMKDIKHIFEICDFCGWEDDGIQNDDHDYSGGANQMSFNQYKKFWEENKAEILKNLKFNKFYAIEKAQEYFKKYFK